MNKQSKLYRFFANQEGKFSTGTVITMIVGVVVLGTVVPALWPTLVGTNTAVAALTQTDAGTATFKVIWPIVLVVVGIGIGAGAIMWAVKKAGFGKG